MRSLLLVLTALFVSLASVSAQVTPPLLVRQGEIIPVKLLEQVSSTTGAEGQTLRMECLADVIIDGRVVILKGTPVIATIVQAKKKAKMGTGGRISLHVSTVKMADGENLALNTTQASSGGGPGAKTYKGLVIASVVLLSPAGAAAALLLHGQEIVLPIGTEMDTQVSDTVTLDRDRFQSATATETSKPEAPRGTHTVSLKVETSTGDGSILVDEKFVGEAPGVLEVERGVRTITVMRNGYKSWKQKVLVEGNPLSLKVDLQKK